MIELLRTDKDGIQYFRAEYWMKDDSHFKDFAKSLEKITSAKVSSKKESDFIEEVIPNLITWLWTDYALMPKHYFSCWHPYDKDSERFNLGALEEEFEEETIEYLSGWVGIPMWAEMSIEYIDLANTVYDMRLEDNWGIRDFLSSWSNSKFLTPEGSAIALIYASESASEGDLIYNSELKDIDKHLIQSDPNWYWNQQTYYNWLDFDVTVDKKEIERENKLIGASYGTLTEEQRTHLVSLAIESMKIKDLESQKVPQYLLTLLLNHPVTSVESKAQIALLGDKHIIKLED